MPSIAFFALLASGLVSVAHAYHVVSFPSPFMYKNIDPIVFLDRYGKSHLHSFFGSDAVTVHTKKSEKLRGGCTAAENINDLSIYWTPTLLYQSGGSWEPVPVVRFSAYYGLGDRYAYKDGEPGRYHDCPGGMQAVPQLRFSIRYDLRGVLPERWSGEAPLQLACGNAYCSHGDFINGWTPEAGEALVEASSDKGNFQDLIGQGETMDCEPTDADPNHGKSTYAESAALIAKRDSPGWGWSSRSRMAWV